MAQHFYNLSISPPLSRNYPPDLGVGSFAEALGEVGVARGVSENVYRIVAPADSTRAEIAIPFAGVSAISSAGEVLIKYRLVSGDSDGDEYGNAPLRLRVGSATEYAIVAPSNVDWSVTRRIRTYFSSQVVGSIDRPANRFDGGTFGTANPSTSIPRYLRVFWSLRGGRVPAGRTRPTSVLSFKMWNSNEAEPSGSSGPLITFYIGSGVPQLLLNNSAMALDMHFMGVEDSTSGAYKRSIPANDPVTLRGGNKTYATPSVRDSADAAIAGARVRLYDQATGTLLGTTLTASDGVATFTVPFDGICYAIITGTAADTSFNFLRPTS